MPPRPRAGVIDRLVAPPSSSSIPITQSPCVALRRAQSLPPPASVCSPLHPSKYQRDFSTSSRLAGMRRRRMMQWLEGRGEDYRQTMRCNYLGRETNDDQSTDEAIEEMMNEVREFEDAKRKGLLTSNPEDKDAFTHTNSKKPRNQDENSDDASTLRTKPFPWNPYFISHPILSDHTKDTIYNRITVQRKSIREVSVEFGVDMNRVGAVVRLKALEERWVKEGKPLAKAYANAIQGMLPVTHFGVEHESINELPTHLATKEQIFYPTSESRPFTRRDAGEVFEKGLKPADERLPHPQLVQMHRDRAAIGRPGSGVADEQAVQARLKNFYETELRRRQSAADRRRIDAKVNTTDFDTPRAIFRIRNVTVDESTVGRDGRGTQGVGARYALPAEDRKKGQYKIPKKWGVEE